MAPRRVTAPVELRLTGHQHALLSRHLFPGDGDEHGAVILAGVTRAGGGLSLIARDVVLAVDGVDYVAGTRGYRMLTADFVRIQSDRAEREGLAYIAVHCHGGSSTVELSGDDRRSHERGYPALLDILDGPPVAGAVFTSGAAAADVWLPDRSRLELDRVLINGHTRVVLTPAPRSHNGVPDPRFGRQALMFGAAGQQILAGLTVAVIGCGGIGSIVVEQLARLGVGHLILIDPDIVTITNLPRTIDATGFDAMSWLTSEHRHQVVQRLGSRLARTKVNVAARVARKANPKIRITKLTGDVADDDVARHLIGTDYMFLAADSFRARLVVNAVAFQYSIPGVQLGAKVRTDRSTGDITDVFSVIRPFGPDSGCLWCNDLIPPGRLAEEAVSVEQQRAQRYVDDPEVAVPSVITLNAVAASHATNEFLFFVTGLRQHDESDRYIMFRPDTGAIERTVPRRDPQCPECSDSSHSRRGRGDQRPLPTTHR